MPHEATPLALDLSQSPLLTEAPASHAPSKETRVETGAFPATATARALHLREERLPLRRLAVLFDDGRFEEIDARVRHQARGWGMDAKRAAGDGVVVACGKIHGQTVVAFAQDRQFMGGSLGEAHARKICKGMDLAERVGAPIVGLIDSGGARIQEGVAALAGYGEIFRRNVRLSGRVPQLSVVLGPCAGGAVYSPAITDFIILSEADALMFVTGPKVVKQAMFEDTDGPSLGGARVHAEKSGVAHIVRPDEVTAIAAARDVLALLVTRKRAPAEAALGKPLSTIVSDNFRRAYDMRDVIHRLVDAGSFLEIQRDYARNILVGMGRIDGRTIGLVANQPKERAGVLDVNASRKAARFIRTMSALGVPIVSLVDVPGFMPGSAQEHNAIITHGAKLLYAYSEARVPRISVILRKAFGGAYIVMSSKHIGADVNLAWPSAQIAVMGAEGAVEVLHGKELQSAADPRTRFDELCGKYRETYMTVDAAAERGWIDKVIDPAHTRATLVHYLDVLEPAIPQDLAVHGNVPL